VLFDFEKTEAEGLTTIVMATFKNKTPLELTDFSCKVAVPKYLQISIGPPSSTVLRCDGGTITQTMNVTNVQRGKKPLKMRLVVNYKRKGQLVSESADVDNFPAGL